MRRRSNEAIFYGGISQKLKYSNILKIKRIDYAKIKKKKILLR